MELKKSIQVKKLPLPQEKTEKGIDKEAVLYIYRKGTNITCGQCVFVENGKCKIFVKSDDTISPSAGSCGFFIHGNSNPDIPVIGSITKVEAGYMENKTGFQCKRCEEFLIEERACKKVNKDSKGDTPRMIHPDACCNRWEADKIRAKLDNIKLDEFIAKHSRK
jgi:hypothetical protein